MITVDGFDIYTKWTLEPMYEGFYNPLILYPSIKERVTEDFEDEDGLSVLDTDGKVKERTFNLSFFCDSYAKYYEFMTYMLEHNPINLYTDYTGRTYKLEYLSCSSFNDNGDYNTFTINFREPNPYDRT